MLSEFAQEVNTLSLSVELLRRRGGKGYAMCVPIKKTADVYIRKVWIRPCRKVRSFNLRL